MAGYGWDEYDVRKGGVQRIHDAGNHLDVQTEFVKVPGGRHGGNWGVRIRGTPRKDAPKDLKSTVVFSVSLEGKGGLEVTNEKDPLGYDGAVTLEGNSPELGSFTLEITKGPDSNAHPVHRHPSYASKPLQRTFAQSYQVPEQGLWQTKRG